jgi:DNA-binding NarL/FixJ family response regulator
MNTPSVLIVEDDPRVRSLIRRILADLVGPVSCSARAGGRPSTCTPPAADVVLMDLRVEGGDGLSATRTIRESSPEARIIIVTSYDAPDLRDAAREAGAMEYLVKDDLSGLRAIVKRATT